MKKIPPKHMRNFKHKLVTRRDFLASGLLSFGAIAALPYFGGMGRSWAAGQSCGGPQAGTSLPFLAFDMAGGGSLPGNFLVGKRGGAQDLLTSYATLGWNPKESGALNMDFGLPMSAKYSQLLQGILQTASAGARANLRMGSFCHVSAFDTTSNPLNAGILVLKSGSRGAYISNGLGLENSLSGGNSAAAGESPLYKPVAVNSVDTILGSTSYGGAAFAEAGIERVKAMAEGAQDLGRIQSDMFAKRPGGPALADASVCAYGKSLEFISGVQGLDPRLDPIAQAVYQIAQNTSASDMNAVAAGLTMNAIDGFSGPATWVLGGCDYHDGGYSTGDAKDLEIGQQIGRAVEFAFRRGRPLFFQLLTDGGNSSGDNTRDWVADSGERTMTVIGYFDPKGPAKMIREQVGQYTNGEGADTTSLIGNDPALVAHAVFANYLNLSGRLGEFATYAPGVFANPGQLESVLIFEGKVS